MTHVRAFDGLSDEMRDELDNGVLLDELRRAAAPPIRDEASLHSLGLANGSLLSLTVLGALPAVDQGLAIELPSSLHAAFGPKLTLSTNSSMTLADLKEAISAATSADTSTLQLRRRGTLLTDDSATLGSHGLGVALRSLQSASSPYAKSRSR